MKTLNFEGLTTEENGKATYFYNQCQKPLSSGIITKTEAVFMWHRLIIKNFDEMKAFDICTNAPEFKQL
ncbi:hypothetical protein ACOJB1_12445 [Enterococcus innesii]|uniref:hypothetical protein n=1 Tax=Enterococcus innesii TaxID=2839759 RepID=UPI003B5D03D5